MSTEERPAPRRDDDDLLLVGIIARAHGIRGAVIVNPESDFPAERFRVGEVLLAGPLNEDGEATLVPRRILEARFHQGRPVIRFEGIESMTEAERLAGLALRVPAAAVSPLPARTYYRHDLVGCEVVGSTGGAIGRVRAVEGTLERSYLLVPRQGGEAMIPLVDGICLSIDVAGRRIVVDPPEGLLDL